MGKVGGNDGQNWDDLEEFWRILQEFWLILQDFWLILENFWMILDDLWMIMWKSIGNDDQPMMIVWYPIYYPVVNGGSGLELLRVFPTTW